MNRNLLLSCGLLSAGVLPAQFGSGDWTTTGFDAQRSFWVRGDAKISLDSMRKPGFGLVWKANVYEGARTKSFATPPVLIDFYIGYRGFRSLGFVGTGANSITTLDTDLGRVEWTKDFKIPAGSASSATCPGGMTSGVARATTAGYPALVAARGFGRGTPAKSGVGEPFEGAVTLQQMANRQPFRPPPPPPAPAKGRRPAADAGSPFAPRIQWLYAVAQDGKLHSMYISNGEEPKDPVSFLPANAYAKGLIVVDNVAYTATANGCGGVDNGIWALDVPSQTPTHWKASGNIAGSTGLAMGPDGTIYTAAGNELVALEERTLKVRGSYKAPGVQFTSSPVVFEHKGKDFVAVTSSDGKLQLFDAGAIDRPVASSAAFSAPNYETGAIASFRDAAGIRWLLVPTGGSVATSGFRGDVKNGGIAAWKVVDQNGTPSFQPGWISRDMISPITPMVVNGVIFAVSSGEHRSGTTAERVKRSVPAVLYAIDSTTGNTLWNSGKTLNSFVTTGGLAAGGSRVYVATQDGTQYVFGFPIEH